jgi:hypothetical protein
MNADAGALGNQLFVDGGDKLAIDSRVAGGPTRETTLPETDYNRKLHSEIGQTPLDRFLAEPPG